MRLESDVRKNRLGFIIITHFNSVDKILVFDPKSGILGLFGFLSPNKSTKLAIFYAFLDSHTKKSKRATEKYAALPAY